MKGYITLGINAQKLFIAQRTFQIDNGVSSAFKRMYFPKYTLALNDLNLSPSTQPTSDVSYYD
tara:strand:+ start:1527 stop:1715 length:189 start_codon:yes stop_codon:yes gene_type:complete